MSYNPKDPESGRHSIRLPGYDYTQPGAYFVTIVTKDRACLFGQIVDDEMILSPLGRIVEWVWKHLPDHFANVETDTFTVMPNHAHGIFWIVDDNGRGDAFPAPTPAPENGQSDEPNRLTGMSPGNASPLPAPTPTLEDGQSDEPNRLTGTSSGNASPRPSPQRPGPPPGSVGAIIGNFKSITTRRINKLRHTPGAAVWQRNYYERIIRNERELNAIRQYILDNPKNWLKDRER